MADTVNSVQPSEVSPEMVAYLLTVSILGGREYSKGVSPMVGLPRIDGCSREEILKTYAACAQVVRSPHMVEKHLSD